MTCTRFPHEGYEEGCKTSKICNRFFTSCFLFFSILQDLYPGNRLRNLAWEVVQTPHVLLTDVDFIPDSNAYKRLRSHIQTGILDEAQRVGT